jgi:transcriptional regulator with XRE-family HTH domain
MTYGGLSAPTTMLLGERIRELRQDRGWTQMELSARSGVGNGRVSELESGKRGFTLLMLMYFARGFEMSVSDLLRGVM